MPPRSDRARSIRSVVIVGGGTAGWMTAAALSRMLDPKSVTVRLVESDQIATVGVGEATIPDMKKFNAFLGISEAEFMRETAGTIKYGIEFVGWTQDGDRYFHPFGQHGVELDGLPFHQYWLRLREQGEASRIEDYCLTALAAKNGTASAPSPKPNSLMSFLAHAYQMDAARYAAFLRRYSEARGLSRIEGKVVDISVNGQDGFIDAVTLEDGQTLDADLFIDCTGFRALLLGGALGTSFEDWSHWLPADTAWVAQTERKPQEAPYTRATAKSAGWQWRVPLQHRVGNGYVYSSRFTDDETAKATFLDGLDGGLLTDPRQIRFKTGARDRFWAANCVGIGLSSGFLEPLESTSIYMIQTGIRNLIALWPDADCAAADRDEYNALMRTEFEQVRDFLLLHYVANERTGQPMWDHFRTLELPDTLQRKIDLFRQSGRFFRYDGDLFTETSWVAVMLGQNIIPKRHNAMADTLPLPKLQESLNGMRDALGRAARAMPSHEAFIAQSGAAMSGAPSPTTARKAS